MGKPAYPLRTKLIAFAAAGLLACGLAPLVGFPQESVAGPLATASRDDSVAASFVLAASKGSGEAATPNPAASSDSDGRAILASSLASSTTSIVSADVALDVSDPVIGSFTVDGLTYAVGPDGLALVAIGASTVSDGAIAVPASVTYDDVPYPVTAIGPYAFYLSGATDVALPDSIASVDGRAFRSSDVARVEVDQANPDIASFDGALYSADKLCLLLIPEGRAGAVLLPCEAEVVEPSVFSHCSLVDAISAGEGGAAFASWEGLLYSVDGTTLLRVPAGATEITVRDGCTTIAAGAMEGCAKLERINAPASVTSISPDLFESVPTITLPAQLALQDATNSGVASALADQVNESADSAGTEGEAEVSPRRVVASSQGLEAPLALPDLGSTSASPSSEASGSASQLTAMVALSFADDDLPEVDPAFIEVRLPEEADTASWRAVGFSAFALSQALQSDSSQDAAIQKALAASASQFIGEVYPNGGTITKQYATFDTNKWEWDVHSTDSISSPEGHYIAYWYYHEWGIVYFNEASGSGWHRGWLYSIDERPGYKRLGFSAGPNEPVWTPENVNYSSNVTAYAQWEPNTYAVSLDAEGGSVSPSSIAAVYDQDLMLPTPEQRPGYRFMGWDTQSDGNGTRHQAGTVRNLTAEDGAMVTLYAQWEPYEIDFDTDSEPGDVGYPGIPKDPVSGASAGPDGTIAIEDPKRPGYVFEGWVIPTEDGTEAVDQDLVYQGADKKWYVDASKLPDYAGDDGRVELTARWTSVISVDVPSSVTFYADLVTQGQESREGAASGGKSNGAFGQNKLSNQSQVDLRVVGLESSAVKTDGSTLGADSILKKEDGSAVSGTADKLLSLYPTTGDLLDGDDLRDPDAVSASKPDGSVDFSLDDVLLEKSFKADDFTIPVGETLNMGYRLNLEDTGTVLDYDKLSTLEEGQSASIANVSYTFAADALPSDWDEPLWIENPDRSSNPAKYLLLDDIKAAANDLSANGTSSEYYSLYKGLLDKQVTDNGNPGAGPYFQLRVDGHYLPLQLIGICQDTKSDGSGKAGLTFQTRDIYAYGNERSADAGGGAFDTRINSTDTNSGGWSSSKICARLQSTFWSFLPSEMQAAITPVNKYQQLPNGATAAYLQKTTNETIWLPSMYEVFGTTRQYYNESEALAINGNVPFQYMAYRPGGAGETNTRAIKTYDAVRQFWWMRSAHQSYTTSFCYIRANGSCASNVAGYACGVAPAFCL